MTQDAFSLTSASDLFKIKYGKISDNTYNNMTPVLSIIKKRFDFVGSRWEQAVPLGYGGGRGGGSLPTADMWDHDTAYFSAAKMYARARIDREAIYASKTDAGGFVDGLKETASKAVEGFTQMIEMFLFGSGDGALGTIDTSGVTDNGSGNYTCVISSATWNKHRFEVGDGVNVETGNTDMFEVTAVAPSTRAVTLQRISGSQVPADGDEIFLQNSEDAVITGMHQAIAASSSSLYNLPVGYRWQASHQKNASSAALSTDLINEACLTISENVGKSPTHCVTSFTQYRKLQDLLEDQKRYTMVPGRQRDTSGKPIVSWPGVEIMTESGPIPVIPCKYCDADKMYFINANYITLFHRKGFGWFDDDGSVFAREANSDSYEARYGGYLQLYAPPTFHGYIHTLAT